MQDLEMLQAACGRLKHHVCWTDSWGIGAFSQSLPSQSVTDLLLMVTITLISRICYLLLQLVFLRDFYTAPKQIVYSDTSFGLIDFDTVVFHFLTASHLSCCAQQLSVLWHGQGTRILLLNAEIF